MYLSNVPFISQKRKGKIVLSTLKHGWELTVFQNLENLENIEPGLNGLFVPWNKMALATEFIFNAVLLFIFYLLSIVVAENVQFIDLFLFGGSSYFVKVNVDHFVSKVFNIDFGKNNFVNFFCPLWVFYVDNSKQGVGAAIQNF